MHDATTILDAGHAMHELLGVASSILGAFWQGHEVAKAGPLVPEGLDQLRIVAITATTQGRGPRLTGLGWFPGMDGHPCEIVFLGLLGVPRLLPTRDGMPWDTITSQHAADPDVIGIASPAEPGRCIPMSLVNVQSLPQLCREEAGPDHVAAHGCDDVYTGQLRQLVGVDDVAVCNLAPVNRLVQHLVPPAVQ